MSQQRTQRPRDAPETSGNTTQIDEATVTPAVPGSQAWALDMQDQVGNAAVQNLVGEQEGGSVGTLAGSDAFEEEAAVQSPNADLASGVDLLRRQAAAFPAAGTIGDELAASWLPAIDALDASALEQAGAGAVRRWQELGQSYLDMENVRDTLLSEIDARSAAAGEGVFELEAMRAVTLDTAAQVEAKRNEMQSRFGTVVGLQRWQGDTIAGGQSAGWMPTEAMLVRTIERSVTCVSRVTAAVDGIDQLARNATWGSLCSWKQRIDRLQSRPQDWFFAELVLRATPLPAGPGWSARMVNRRAAGASNGWNLYENMLGADEATHQRERQQGELEERGADANAARAEANADAAVFAAEAQVAAESAYDLRPPSELDEAQQAALDNAVQSTDLVLAAAASDLESMLAATAAAGAAINTADGASFSAQAATAEEAAARYESALATARALLTSTGIPDVDTHPSWQAANTTFCEARATWEADYRNEVLVRFSVQSYRDEDLFGGYTLPAWSGSVASYIATQAPGVDDLLSRAAQARAAMPEYEGLNRFTADAAAAGLYATVLNGVSGLHWMYLVEVMRDAGAPASLITALEHYGRDNAREEATLEHQGLDEGAIEAAQRAVSIIEGVLDDGIDEAGSDRITAALTGLDDNTREHAFSLLVQHNTYDLVFQGVEESAGDYNLQRLRCGRFLDSAYAPETIYEGGVANALEYSVDATAIGTTAFAYGAVESIPMLGEAMTMGVGDDFNAALMGMGDELGMHTEDTASSLGTGRLLGNLWGTGMQTVITAGAGSANAGNLLRTTGLALEGAGLVNNAYTASTGRSIVSQTEASDSSRILAGLGVVGSVGSAGTSGWANNLDGWQGATQQALSGVQRGSSAAGWIDPTMQAATGFDAMGNKTEGLDRYAGLIGNVANVGFGRLGSSYSDYLDAGGTGDMDLGWRAQQQAAPDTSAPGQQGPSGEEQTSETGIIVDPSVADAIIDAEPPEMQRVVQWEGEEYTAIVDGDDYVLVRPLGDGQAEIVRVSASRIDRVQPAGMPATEGFSWTPQDSTDVVEGMSIYWDAIGSDQTREVAVVQHVDSGSVRIIQGGGSTVSLGALGDDWVILRHYHPTMEGPELLARRLPSVVDQGVSADLNVLESEGARVTYDGGSTGGERLSQIDYIAPNGARAQTQFGYDPSDGSCWVRFSDLDGSSRRESFGSLGDYQTWFRTVTMGQRSGNTLELPAVTDT